MVEPGHLSAFGFNWSNQSNGVAFAMLIARLADE
jgi:hypothetical protein